MGERPITTAPLPTDGGEQQGTTTFTTSVEAVQYDRHASASNPISDHDLEVNDIREIADFLAKPMPVSSGTFTTANVAGDNLLNSDIYTLLVAQSIWLNKIQGYLNIRGNVKLRLVINPTPFQAGLLRLSYFPCANQMNFEMNAHIQNRMSISQLPGTYLNLNNNFCEVTVPYIAPTTFLERDQVATGAHVSWGNVLIHVFQPLKTGTGPTSINWTLWMSVEDLELSGMVQPQMAKGRRRLPSDEEANCGKGPVSYFMSSASKVARSLSTIPELAPIAVPAAWVTSAVAGVASAFGWSKPTDSEPVAKFVSGQQWYSMNSRGGDSSAPLSLDPDNKIQPIADASPGSLDEMSVNYIKSIWSFYSTVTWNSASAAGALLYNRSINPNQFVTFQTIGGVVTEQHAPCTIFSKMYNQFRGSFEVRLRLVKTGFHTGTIAVGFAPGLAAIVPSYADSAYVYRQIIDIQDGTEFVFNLPFLIPQDYIDVAQYMGNFFVYIVNPLVAPATVASSIDIQLEVRGGNDLTYAVPVEIKHTPFVPQGVDVEDAGESTALTLGSRSHELDNIAHAAHAIGEWQGSVAEILKAAYPMYFNVASTTPTTGGGCCYMATSRNYAARYNGITTTSSELGGDLLSFVSSWYVFRRGSTRWRLMPLSTSALPNVTLRAAYVPSNSAWNVVTTGAYTWWSNDAPNTSLDSSFANMLTGSNAPSANLVAGAVMRMHQLPATNAGIAVQAPFYSYWRYELNRLICAFGQTAQSFSSNGGVAFYAPNLNKALVFRSAGDDFQLSYFIGIPLITRSAAFFTVNS